MLHFLESEGEEYTYIKLFKSKHKSLVYIGYKTTCYAQLQVLNLTHFGPFFKNIFVSSIQEMCLLNLGEPRGYRVYSIIPLVRKTKLKSQPVQCLSDHPLIFPSLPRVHLIMFSSVFPLLLPSLLPSCSFLYYYLFHAPCLTKRFKLPNLFINTPLSHTTTPPNETPCLLSNERGNDN